MDTANYPKSLEKDKTQQEQLQCPCCLKSDFKPYKPTVGHAESFDLQGKSFTYRICQVCDLICADPMPTDQDLQLYYGKYFDYSAYARVAFFKKRQARQRATWFKKFLKGDEKILDVGCGHGYFVNALEPYCRESHGYDISESPRLSKFGNSQLHFLPSLNDLDLTDFDVITLWHTFEHFNNPQKNLTDILGKLKPGGILLIAVPNSNSYGVRTSGYRWNWLQMPYVHPYHYNKDNLGMLLKRNDLAITDQLTRNTWDSNLGDSLPLFRKPKNEIIKRLPPTLARWIDMSYRELFSWISFLSNPLVDDSGAELIIVGKLSKQ